MCQRLQPHVAKAAMQAQVKCTRPCPVRMPWLQCNPRVQVRVPLAALGTVREVYLGKSIEGVLRRREVRGHMQRDLMRNLMRGDLMAPLPSTYET